jgi:hypothetical protein
MEAVTLYAYQDHEIKISIEAYFEGDALIIDGYDIGKKVEDYWGDSDYEYKLTIPPVSVAFLYNYLGIAASRELLLQTLATRFNTNTCFSDIRNVLDQHRQPCEGFSWT